jgi:predicted XRE-type DNA-binding protein
MKPQTKLLQQQIATLRQQGMSVNDIAAKLHYTQSRISQLSDPAVKRKYQRSYFTMMQRMNKNDA